MIVARRITTASTGIKRYITNAKVAIAPQIVAEKTL